MIALGVCALFTAVAVFAAWQGHEGMLFCFGLAALVVGCDAAQQTGLM